MAYEFKMPMVAESVVEGEIGRWLVKEGDFVKRDQPLVEVLTDKVNVEIPSPYEGYLLKILASEGKVAKVGELLAIIGAQGERVESIPQPLKATESVKAGPSPTATPPQATPVAAPGLQPAFEAPQAPGEIKAMPRVRQLAKELGVDLAAVRGTGPQGLITEDDVKAATGITLPAPTPTPKPAPSPRGPEERVPLKGIRRIVARNMRRSLDTVAQTLHVDEADVTELRALRDSLKAKAEERGIKLTYLPFFIKAIVAALRRYPEVNASIDDEHEELVIKHYYNIGIATNTDEGLVVPVLKDADKKDIFELARDIAELAEKTRAGKLSLEDVQGSTFSITNIGSLRGQISFPIINHPDAAIIGIQSITKRPVVRDGQIVIRDMVNLSLAFDHRVFDGAVASNFTTEVIRRLETPALLFWDEGH